jgi:deazaflavin-dependent oxidoreductase (nitroreductase family)
MVTRAEFNAKIIEEFRANGGRVSGELASASLILVHHVGARSGLERIVPLVYSPQPDGRMAIIASNGGSQEHPAWYHNLKAKPQITVEVGSEVFTVIAEELEAQAREAIIVQSEAATAFQAASARAFPVFLLSREE